MSRKMLDLEKALTAVRSLCETREARFRRRKVDWPPVYWDQRRAETQTASAMVELENTLVCELERLAEEPEPPAQVCAPVELPGRSPAFESAVSRAREPLRRVTKTALPPESFGPVAHPPGDASATTRAPRDPAEPLPLHGQPQPGDWDNPAGYPGFEVDRKPTAEQEPHACPVCMGRGRLPWDPNDPLGSSPTAPTTWPCRICSGSGVLWR